MTDTRVLDDIDRTTPIGTCLAGWHELFRGDRDALARVLADDVVLHSPVLFAPVHGKELVTLYLTGAAMTFVDAAERTSDAASGAATPTAAPARADGDGDEWDGSFRYVRMVTGERDAVLEFETTMSGRYVNGVDMITCDDRGMIVDVKVMVRPRQAVEAVREMMAAALDQLQT